MVAGDVGCVDGVEGRARAVGVDGGSDPHSTRTCGGGWLSWAGWVCARRQVAEARWVIGARRTVAEAIWVLRCSFCARRVGAEAIREVCRGGGVLGARGGVALG